MSTIYTTKDGWVEDERRDAFIPRYFVYHRNGQILPRYYKGEYPTVDGYYRNRRAAIEALDRATRRTGGEGA